ncbi:MAG: peptide deformylase, partial [Anaerolineales bacterium]
EEGEAEPAEPELYQLVNPEIVHASRETALGNEGCLSIPGYYGEVERSLKIALRGFTPQGEPIQIQADGWLARIFQHEVDHLNGVLFIDRANRIWEVDEEEAGEITAA